MHFSPEFPVGIVHLLGQLSVVVSFNGLVQGYKSILYFFILTKLGNFVQLKIEITDGSKLSRMPWREVGTKTILLA